MLPHVEREHMSFVEIHFKKAPQKETKRCDKVEIRSALGGKLRLTQFEGSYEVWLDGHVVLGPTSKEAAQIRFDALLAPTCAEAAPVPQETKEEVQKEPGAHQCPSCGRIVSGMRKQLLGTDLCAQCTPQGNIPLGVMDYSEKAGGVLMVVEDRELFRILKKPVNQQR